MCVMDSNIYHKNSCYCIWFYEKNCLAASKYRYRFDTTLKRFLASGDKTLCDNCSTISQLLLCQGRFCFNCIDIISFHKRFETLDVGIRYNHVNKKSNIDSLKQKLNIVVRNCQKNFKVILC